MIKGKNYRRIQKSATNKVTFSSITIIKETFKIISN